MATYLSQGRREQSCIEFALRTQYFVSLSEWGTYWTVSTPEEATHIGIFRAPPESSDATRLEDMSLDHVAAVKTRHDQPGDWVLDQK